MSSDKSKFNFNFEAGIKVPLKDLATKLALKHMRNKQAKKDEETESDEPPAPAPRKSKKESKFNLPEPDYIDSPRYQKKKK